MGCHGSKNSAPAQPEGKQEIQPPATSTLLDSTPDSGKAKVEADNATVAPSTIVDSTAVTAATKETAATSSLLDSFGGLDVLKADIDRMSVAELAAYLAPLSEDAKGRLNVAIKDAAPTFGGLDVLKADIDRMSVAELAAYLAPLSEDAKGRLNVAIKDAAPAPEKVDIELPQADNLQEAMQNVPVDQQNSPDRLDLHVDQQNLPVDPVGTAVEIEVLPSAAGKMGGYFSCANGYCTTTETQSEIVVGQDV